MVEFILEDQKDASGKVVDKIAVITTYTTQTERKSFATLRTEKMHLQESIETINAAIAEIDEILGDEA